MTLDLKRGKVLLVVLVVLFSGFIFIDLNLKRVEGSTTTQFFAETTDGYIGCTSLVSYVDCRAGMTLNTDTVNNMSVGQWFSVVPANTWAIQRSGVEFDTTSIPSDATISSVTFGVMWATDNSLTDFHLRLHSSNWTTGGLTNADWTMLLDGTAIGSIASSADYSADTWITISVPAVFINRTGNTQFSMISWEDTNNSAPLDEEFTDLWHADMTGTSYDPYLNITYTIPDDVDDDRYIGLPNPLSFSCSEILFNKIRCYVDSYPDGIDLADSNFIWRIDNGTNYTSDSRWAEFDLGIYPPIQDFEITLELDTKGVHDGKECTKKYSVGSWFVLLLISIFVIFIVSISTKTRVKRGTRR